MTALLMVGGCASGNGSDYVQYFRAMRQSVSASMGRGNVTKAQASAIPYASLAWREGKSPQQILVLATDANGETLWTAATHVVLNIRDGRVVRSVGLSHDIAAQSPLAGGQLPAPAAALAAPFTTQRQEDFPDIGAYGVHMDCTARAFRRETVTILGTKIPTMRVDERCRAPSLRWSFVDSYWLDAESGFVWRSVQHVHPKAEALEIHILRPPG